MTVSGDEIVALQSLSPTELKKAWQRAWRAPPPMAATPDILMRGIAWKLQERAHGTLSRSTRDALKLIADRTGPCALPQARRLKPGTRLVRSWGGKTHAVLVTDDGYMFEDRIYRSLSAIAKEISGAHWSGPSFFGLRKRKGARSNGK